MPVSPPTRMTRSRARAAHENVAKTKITTRGAQAAAAGSTSRGLKRKAPAIEPEGDDTSGPDSRTRKRAAKEHSLGAKPNPTHGQQTERPSKISTQTKKQETKVNPSAQDHAKRAKAMPLPVSQAETSRAVPRKPTATQSANRVLRRGGHDIDKENRLPYSQLNDKTRAKESSELGLGGKPLKLAVLGNAETPRTVTSKPGAAAKAASESTGTSLNQEVSSVKVTAGALSADAQQSPTKCSGMLQASPARRPPPSPFKDALRTSPKKGELCQVLFDMTSAKKPDIPSSNLGVAQTPKRFPIQQLSSAQVNRPGTTTDLQLSLLHSPAKRPLSPLKDRMLASLPGIKPMAGEKTPIKTYLLQSPKKLHVSFPHHEYCNSESAKSTAFRGADRRDVLGTLPPDVVEETDIEKYTSRSALDEISLAAAEKNSACRTGDKKWMTAKNMEDSTVADLDRKSTTPGKGSIGRNGSSVKRTSSNSRSPTITPKSASQQYYTSKSERSRYPVLGDESPDELQSIDEIYHVSATPVSRKRVCNTRVVEVRQPQTIIEDDFEAMMNSKPLYETAVDTPTMDDVRMSLETSPKAHPELELLYDEELAAFAESAQNTSKESVSSGSPAKNSEQAIDWVTFSDAVDQADQPAGDENIPPPPRDCVDEIPISATPARLISRNPTVVHTVSKIPLKPCLGSKMNVTEKRSVYRSLSLSGSLTSQGMLELQALRQIHPPSQTVADTANDISSASMKCLASNAEKSVDETENVSGTALEDNADKSLAHSKLLSGAVVFVDVYTSEGADASGIFIDLLTQMGARCVREWRWRCGNGTPHEGSQEKNVGITHVVFKDGGKRTMEKVREARGLVNCVGVAWVLDCEREGKWLDENEYAIDAAFVPRGGHRRRKSMEPKSLRKSLAVSNDVEAISSAALPVARASPTKAFLDLQTPRGKIAKKGNEDELESGPAPRTPKGNPYIELETDGAESPTTPYFPHGDALMQQTCPPKHSFQKFFPLSGEIEDEPDAQTREMLRAARRKSAHVLKYAPRVASPLTRDFMR